MVTSITFDGKSGYIGEKYTSKDKPVKPNKNSFVYNEFDHETFKRVFNDEKYNSDIEKYNLELEFYNKNKGKYKVDCSKFLVGRKFEFSSDRINIIFGPNASGKTTILKSIASHALCTDGFSKYLNPLDIPGLSLHKEHELKDYQNGIFEEIQNLSGTSSVIEWDGSPIYYHNFENRVTYGYFGELTGSIIENTSEEMFYILGKRRMSGGENMFFQLSKLGKLMKKNITYEEILYPYKKKYEQFPETDCLKMTYNAQESYYKLFPKAFDKNGQNTYLFDEIDKSMDMLNVYDLYSKALPKLKEKYKKQIITITHSPVVLIDEIYKSDNYNFISIDEDYTKKCIDIFNHNKNCNYIL